MVFEDPGSGALLDRVRRRVPAAKSATTVFAANGRIVDAQVLVGNAYPVSGFPVKVLYPNSTTGNSLVPGDDHLAASIGSTAGSDIDVLRIAWSEANAWRCSQFTTGGALRIFVKVRDEFGQVDDFEIATLTYTKGGQNDTVNIWQQTERHNTI